MRRFAIIEVISAALSGVTLALAVLAAVIAAEEVPLTPREFATVLIAAATTLILAVVCWMESRRVQRDSNMTLLIRTLPAAPVQDRPQGRPAQRRTGGQEALRVVSSR